GIAGLTIDHKGPRKPLDHPALSVGGHNGWIKHSSVRLRACPPRASFAARAVFRPRHSGYDWIYSTSKSPAAPMPPPTHMVTTTQRTPRLLPSISAWPTMRAPDIP